MPRDQAHLNDLLNQVHTFPVEISTDAPIPFTRPAYQCLTQIERSGFSFTVRDLLHAIGCKTAALPMSESDECIKSAWVFTHVLDLEAQPICFRPTLDSDLQTPRSQELGIGMACLFANHYYQIPWDQLGPITAKGARFDYRGQNPQYQCIFESKATKYKYSQPDQIASGINKKQAHHSRGENFDVELIISTHVGGSGDDPRILIGDPPFEKLFVPFDEDAKEFYLFRHFSRVMQFIGFPSFAKYLNEFAKSRFYYKSSFQDYLAPRLDFPRLETVSKRGMEFVGRYFDNWVPPNSLRYKHLEKYQIPSIFPRKLRVFQGISKSILLNLFERGPKAIEFKTFDYCKDFSFSTPEKEISYFPDSTMMFYEF